ncbi:MAG: hypothetical protein HOE62_00805, partial [Alphaproteobacteria bacterium]|nr:hypothetical protein [Alphaproteobacteria bacterium]
MQAKLFVQAEEAIWGGDKKAEGILKDTITGETTNIEKKGIDVITVRNFARLGITSNNNWVVPAGPEERRFFVLDVSDTHIQDKTYFMALYDQMENGGYEALLHYLENYDYSDIDLRAIPYTSALLEQKIYSLGPVAKFWYEALERGTIGPDEYSWPDFVVKDDLRDSYCESAGKAGQGYKGWQTEFGKALNQFCPGIQSKR